MGLHNLTGLNESSLALRERIKDLIQAVFGRKAAHLAHRYYQGLGDWLRRHKATGGDLQLPVEDLLSLAAASRATLQAETRVLLLLPRLAPGGAEKSALDLIRGLSEQGVTVHAVTTFGSDNPWAGRTRETGRGWFNCPVSCHGAIGWPS